MKSWGSLRGWLYLAVVIDLYSRQIIGWAMSERMKTKVVCDALTMALFRRGFPSGVIVHSDRGSQYCSKRYRRLLEKHALRCSMSKRGDCFDNACVESFFHTLKIELIHGTRYSAREELRHEVFEYIESYYNDASYCPSRYVLEKSRSRCFAGGTAGRFACR